MKPGFQSGKKCFWLVFKKLSLYPVAYNSYMFVVGHEIFHIFWNVLSIWEFSRRSLVCVFINSIVLMIPCVLSLVGYKFAGMAPVWFAPYGRVRFLSLPAHCSLLWNPRAIVKVCFGLIQWHVPNGVCVQAGIIHTSGQRLWPTILPLQKTKYTALLWRCWAIFLVQYMRVCGHKS